jgi:hypothetical protein
MNETYSSKTFINVYKNTWTNLDSEVKHEAVRVFFSQSIDERAPCGMFYHLC